MRSRDSIALLVLLSATGLTNAQQFPGWNPGAASLPTQIILVGSAVPAGAGTASISSGGIGRARVSGNQPGFSPVNRMPEPQALVPAPTPAMINPTPPMANPTPPMANPTPPMANPTPAPAGPITSAPLFNSTPTRAASFDKTAESPALEVSGEFLLWWVKSAPNMVPLVTGAPNGPARIGLPDTQILSGNDRFDYGLTPGFRLGGTLWLGEGVLGVSGGGFFLGRQADTNTFSTGADGTPSVARPFIVANGGNSAALAVGLAGLASGSVVVDSTTQLWGADVNAVAMYSPMEHVALKGFLGFRYLDLLETLSISQGTNLLPGAAQPFGGNTITGPALVYLTDEFDTRNQFYGPQIGTQVDFRHGRFNGSIGGKVALGSMHQVLDIRGVSTGTPMGSTVGLIGAGGLLAQPSNIGRYERDQFAVIPEVGAKVGVSITDRLSATVGYDFLFVSNVLRPANQLDANVSPSLIVASSSFTGTGTRPAVVLDSSDFWAQGISLGISYQY